MHKSNVCYKASISSSEMQRNIQECIQAIAHGSTNSSIRGINTYFVACAYVVSQIVLLAPAAEREIDMHQVNYLLLFLVQI